MRSAPRFARTTEIERSRKIALEDRVVPRDERVDGERPEPRPVEDDLDGDRAGDDVAEVDRDDGHRRQERVREGVVRGGPARP